MLNICPLLNVDYEGHLTPREKIRTKKKVVKRIVEKMVEEAYGGLNYVGKCYLSDSDVELGDEVQKLIEETFPQLKGREKRKSEDSKEGLLGVEGVDDEVIIEALRKSPATIIGEDSRDARGEITKAALYDLGLSGRENSKKLREALLYELGMPSYLTTNAMLSALNCLYSLEELKSQINKLSE